MSIEENGDLKAFERDSYEGWTPELTTPEQVSKAIAIALDFRGDVTLHTSDGKEITGFVFNTEPRKKEPYLDIFPKGKSEKTRLPYGAVTGISFASFDPAAGRSWGTWVRKYNERKKALTEGRDIGEIEPQPLPLDD